ncbi:MAG: ACP S-malonyltransferase [Candidatus Kapabacteria bacterium]|nr:ACP S-malonyltransferase [Candidatus Kapabacteria bacterium]MDW8011590.1 ACP S-malonyltransferase [Bacteroidota bacterium]
MRAWLFPGQGSQYVGMMRGFPEAFPQAREYLERAEAILGFDVYQLCIEGPEERLRQTEYTQPALFVHEAIVVEVVREVLPADAVAGHSLGEFSALYAAGVLSFEDTLWLVKLRGEAMAEAGRHAPGAMAAVIGLEDAVVEDIVARLSRDNNNGVLVAANYNAPGQVVISGSAELVRAAIAHLREAGATKVIELAVSGAFHSPLMEPARQRLAEAIAATTFSPAQIPIYCNVSATPLQDAEQLRQTLLAQLTSPVRWRQTLERMYADGIREFVELGPGRVLQGLVRRTLSGVSVSGIDTIQDVLQVRGE